MNKADKLAIEYLTANYRRRSEILKKLYKINAGLMNIIARPIFQQDKEDFYSAMRIRFIKAIHTFKPRKGSFYLHLKWQLRGERHEYCRKNHMVHKDECLISLNKKAGKYKNHDLIEELPSKEVYDYEHGPISIIKPLITPKELEIIKTWLKALAMTKKKAYGAQKMAGQMLGMTGEGFRQRFNAVMEKIRFKMGLLRNQYI